MTFKRHSTEQIFDESYELVDVAADIDITAKGSIQPYEQDNESGTFPEGKDATTAYLFFTKETLEYAERRTQKLADTTTIRGRDYEVYPYEDWSVDLEEGGRNRTMYKSYLLVERTEDGT
jgi:hypothetical protein